MSQLVQMERRPRRPRRQRRILPVRRDEVSDLSNPPLRRIHDDRLTRQRQRLRPLIVIPPAIDTVQSYVPRRIINIMKSYNNDLLHWINFVRTETISFRICGYVPIGNSRLAKYTLFNLMITTDEEDNLESRYIFNLCEKQTMACDEFASIMRSVGYEDYEDINYITIQLYLSLIGKSEVSEKIRSGEIVWDGVLEPVKIGKMKQYLHKMKQSMIMFIACTRKYRTIAESFLIGTDGSKFSFDILDKMRKSGLFDTEMSLTLLKNILSKTSYGNTYQTVREFRMSMAIHHLIELIIFVKRNDVLNSLRVGDKYAGMIKASTRPVLAIGFDFKIQLGVDCIVKKRTIGDGKVLYHVDQKTMLMLFDHWSFYKYRLKSGAILLTEMIGDFSHFLDTSLPKPKDKVLCHDFLKLVTNVYRRKMLTSMYFMKTAKWSKHARFDISKGLDQYTALKKASRDGVDVSFVSERRRVLVDVPPHVQLMFHKDDTH